MIVCKQTHKTAHPSRGAAEAALRALKKTREYFGKPYPCPYCQRWHIGREKLGSHKNKYKKGSH
jgi:hypothetical protein